MNKNRFILAILNLTIFFNLQRQFIIEPDIILVTKAGKDVVEPEGRSIRKRVLAKHGKTAAWTIVHRLLFDNVELFG